VRERIAPQPCARLCLDNIRGVSRPTSEALAKLKVVNVYVDRSRRLAIDMKHANLRNRRDLIK